MRGYEMMLKTHRFHLDLSGVYELLNYKMQHFCHAKRDFPALRSMSNLPAASCYISCTLTV